MVEARDQVANPIKLVIAWYCSTRYLDISPPTRDDVERLSSLQITCGEPYSPYSPFGKSTRQFKFNNTCPEMGRLNIVWNNEKIQ